MLLLGELRANWKRSRIQRVVFKQTVIKIKGYYTIKTHSLGPLESNELYIFLLTARVLDKHSL